MNLVFSERRDAGGGGCILLKKHAAFPTRFVRPFRLHSGKLASLRVAQTVPSVEAGSTNLLTEASQCFFHAGYNPRVPDFNRKLPVLLRQK